MNIKMFNGWYFFWLILSLGSVIGCYFLLRKRRYETQKLVLFYIMLFAIALHFIKMLIPPYSLDAGRLLRDSWFINICGANILLFPFIYMSKNDAAKDYMFYVGVLSGFISIIYPMEPMAKANQMADILDIIRFYIHHNIIWMVPLFMVLFKHHTLSYKRVLKVPVYFLAVMLFIMLNQLFQSELGFIELRSSDFFDINYKNSSLIWGPGDDSIGTFLGWFCPDFFKTVPAGQFKGETKYWPWFWLIFPMYLVLVPICFLISLIFDRHNLVNDFENLRVKVYEYKEYANYKKENSQSKQTSEKVKHSKKEQNTTTLQQNNDVSHKRKKK